MDLKRCDQCRTERRAESRWFQLETTGVREMGEPNAWHFCSWHCVWVFATTRDEDS